MLRSASLLQRAAVSRPAHHIQTHTPLAGRWTGIVSMATKQVGQGGGQGLCCPAFHADDRKARKEPDAHRISLSH